MKKILYFVLTFVVVVLTTGGYYYQKYHAFINQPVFNQRQVINIDKGQNFKKFTEDVLKRGGSGKAWQWRLFARLEKVGTWLKVGEFEISPQLTPLQMMKKIKTNDVVTYQFTIVEGTNWKELKDKLAENTVLLQTLQDYTDDQLLLKIDARENHLEGLFLPETYQFVRGDSDFDVLKRAHQALQKHMQKVWSNRKKDLPLNTPYEMLILASIVEKETAQVDERNKVAGVFTRRLKRNMKLQTDPTVIYGLGEAYDGDIKSKDLTTDTPYNTYTRKGLPPTPIAMASAAAITASANPEDGKALYFVANNRGGHYFSETYEEHKNAVQLYLKGKKL